MEEKTPAFMIGTWAWGSGIAGSRMVFGHSYEVEELWKAFLAATKAGYLLWDTAEVYGMGNAEKILGNFKKRCKNIQISTKCMPKRRYVYGNMTKSLKKSLARLGTDYADIYWLHVPVQIEKNLSEMAELAKKGLIKQIGVSNFNLKQLKKAEKQLESLGLRISCVQNHYSLISHRKEDDEMIAWCHKKGIVYYSYMVLEQGALTGRFDSRHPFPAWSNRWLSFPRRRLKKLEPLLAYMKKLAQKQDGTVSQVAMRWAMNKGTVPIVGVTKASYVEDLKKAETFQISDEQMKRLEELAARTGLMMKGIWE
ncbi:MAG: aldo/keto reductase [Clostridiales bacterium]|nr:aldo/keto reductase [Clostridiales bacterium]